jgi:hypothetical protein
METFDASQLPALCDTAIRDLAEVKTIGECLQIRDVMEAARVYARKHKMAQEAQDAVTKIVVLAERRIGQELIAAQQRGELASRSDGYRFMERVAEDNSLPATLPDVGIDRVSAYRFKQMADLDDEEIEQVAAEARERGKPVAKADFKRKAAAKRQQPTPVVPPRPDHLNHFSLWLRNGARLVEQFADHREAMSLANRFGVFIDPEQVREIVEFLAALSAGLEADRAA